MNIKHKVDMNRPFAEAYMNNRTAVAFWSGLSGQTVSAIELYFSDAALSISEVSEICNTDPSSFAKVMQRRGVYAPTHSRRKPVIERFAGEDNTPPKLDDPIADIVASLKGQQVAISTEMNVLSERWDKIQSAINAVTSI